MTKIFCDFETRSFADISETGAYRYIFDKTTEITCCAYAIDNGPVQLLKKDELHQLKPLILDPNNQFIAHNAFFEQCVCRKLFPDLEINPKRWKCTAAKAAAASLPRSLEKVAEALGLAIKKDAEGRRIMLRLAKPKIKDDVLAFYEPTEEELNKLYEYCKTDVEVERLIDQSIPDLIPAEQDVWVLDQEINFRGVQLDMELVHAAIHVFGEYEAHLIKQIKEFTKGELDGATRISAMCDWIEKRTGSRPENLTKATVNALLDSNIPEDVRKLLMARRTLGKTSVKKFHAMKASVCDDGRVRDLLMYHGAGTGRWSGKMLQTQNLPRGSVKNVEDCIEVIKQRDWTMVDMLFDDVGAAVSSCIRGAIIAAPGKSLVVSDYASIEARVLLWCAGDEAGLDKYRQGVDLYCDMASVIYGRSITPENKKERQLGKAAILGCFAPNTLVLTDEGLLPIQYVKPCNKVWDGIEWVSTGGAICQGVKDVIHLAGIGVTPDHQILTQASWVSAYQGESENTSFLQSALYLAKLGLSHTFWALEEGLKPSTCLAHVIERISILLISIISCQERQLDAILARKLNQTNGENIGADMRILCQTMPTEKDFSIEYPQSYKDVQTKNVKYTHRMAEGASLYSPTGLLTANFFFLTLLHLMDGITLCLKSIAETTKKGMSLIIYDLLRGLKMLVTKGLYRKCKSASKHLPKKTLTYDLAYCGPRNRFTVLTDKGFIIVHNCGYGMGHSKFYQTCLTQKVEVDERLAELTVQKYRATYRKVTKHWSDMEKVAKLTINSKQPTTCGKVKFLTKKDFLVMVLPSGRPITYYKPRISALGKIEFMGVNATTKQFCYQSIWGGTLVENEVQAISRDLLVNGMFKAENIGYSVVMHVHDEIVAEVSSEKAYLNFDNVISQLPNWGTGIPLEAEGFVSRRYRK